MASLEWAEIEAFDNAEKTRLSLKDMANLATIPNFKRSLLCVSLALAYPVNDLLLKIVQRRKRSTSRSNARRGEGAPIRASER